jgi:nicotinamide riboside kinase
MIIGLTGYHSSGKSVISQFLAKEFNWRWILKRKLLQEWSGVGDDEYAWTEWYRDLYNRMGSYQIMHHLLKKINYQKNKNEIIILDAIHTPEEWSAIKEIDFDSLLVGVFIPKECRLQRSSPEDLVLDLKRQQYWHTGENNLCLLSQIEWSFCGTANQELRLLEAKALFEHLINSGKIC